MKKGTGSSGGVKQDRRLVVACEGNNCDVKPSVPLGTKERTKLACDGNNCDVKRAAPGKQKQVAFATHPYCAINSPATKRPASHQARLMAGFLLPAFPAPRCAERWTTEAMDKVNRAELTEEAQARAVRLLAVSEKRRQDAMAGSLEGAS